ncbi:MAG TPA: hypothetical protein DIU15_04605, partial [Deltaproteobacteria bacterium]|nr:hypothetical protein [Deltaproteobacteria bacterium]
GPQRERNNDQGGDDDDSADDGSVTDDDDSAGDDAAAGDSAVIVRTVPEPSEPDFFFRSNLEVEWSLPPNEASLDLRDAAGSAVGGSTEMENSGRTLVFDPDDDLSPSSQYTVTVSWSGDDSPLVFEFSTGSYGEQLDGAAEQGLVGRVFNLDLTAGNFVEPPGVGAILQSQIDDVAILFTMTAESNFDPASQPGLHILGAVGEIDGGQVSTDACSETLGFTYGADGVLGTSDDSPARWENPSMELGPTTLELNLSGLATTIEDLLISGAFHPELDDMQGGVFEGKIDTRPLAPVLDPEGGEDALCALILQTVGVDCEPCNDDGTEPFCLDLVIEDIPGVRVDGLSITPTTCVDIINSFVADGTTCQEAAEAYDADADADGV